MIRDRLDVVKVFFDFVFLFSEDSLAAPIEEVPEGVAADRDNPAPA